LCPGKKPRRFFPGQNQHHGERNKENTGFDERFVTQIFSADPDFGAEKPSAKFDERGMANNRLFFHRPTPAVEFIDPMKRGLKQVYLTHRLITHFVEFIDPMKRGLKPFPNRCRAGGEGLVEFIDPMKRGLKRIKNATNKRSKKS
jgi:hypothetical protein